MKLSDFKRRFFKKRTRKEWFDLFVDGFVRYRHRAGRGNSLTNEFKGLIEMFAYGGIIILLLDRVFGVLVPIWALPILWVLQKVLEVGFAILDQKKLKIWQKEIAWAKKHIDPIEIEKMKRLRKLSKDVEEIKEKLKGQS